MISTFRSEEFKYPSGARGRKLFLCGKHVGDAFIEESGEYRISHIKNATLYATPEEAAKMILTKNLARLVREQRECRKLLAQLKDFCD